MGEVRGVGVVCNSDEVELLLMPAQALMHRTRPLLDTLRHRKHGAVPAREGEQRQIWRHHNVRRRRTRDAVARARVRRDRRPRGRPVKLRRALAPRRVDVAAVRRVACTAHSPCMRC